MLPLHTKMILSQVLVRLEPLIAAADSAYKRDVLSAIAGELRGVLRDDEAEGARGAEQIRSKGNEQGLEYRAMQTEPWVFGAVGPHWDFPRVALLALFFSALLIAFIFLSSTGIQSYTECLSAHHSHDVCSSFTR